MLTDEDEGEGESYKPSLDSIMMASCIDDWGRSYGMVQRILGYCRSWRHSRDNSSLVGCSENMVPIKMAGKKAQSAG